MFGSFKNLVDSAFVFQHLHDGLGVGLNSNIRAKTLRAESMKNSLFELLCSRSGKKLSAINCRSVEPLLTFW